MWENGKVFIRYICNWWHMFVQLRISSHADACIMDILYTYILAGTLDEMGITIATATNYDLNEKERNRPAWNAKFVDDDDACTQS